MTQSVENEALEGILAERLGRPPSGPRPSLIDRSFPKQAAFIEDPASLKAAFCTRRAAKSYSGGIGLFDANLEVPGCSTLYIALTKDSARKIMWKDVLKPLNRQHGLGAKFNETKLTVTFPNEAMTYLTGVDADEEEMEKLLGQKYRRVVLDEASLYSIDLRKLVYGILKPAIADYRGDIWLLGTAGDLTQGLFFDITQGLEPGWSLHQWSAWDNPYIRDKWQAELDEIDRLRPLFKKTNLYKQWYLNQWVIDTNKLVYRYEVKRNDFQALPFFPRGQWQYVLGVDLGYSPDPSAFALVGFHENDKTLYGIESSKQLEMDITDVANRIKWYQSNYPIYKVIIDGSNKQAVEEMQKRHDLALSNADKRGKADFIQLLNDEFIQEKIKVNPQKNEGLIAEWKKLVWKTEGDKIIFPREEHPTLPNHCADAFLYAWRFCYAFLSAPAKPEVNLKTKEEFRKHTEKLMEEQLERDIRRQEAQDAEEDFMALSELDPFDQEQDVLKHFLNKRRR